MAISNSQHVLHVTGWDVMLKNEALHVFLNKIRKKMLFNVLLLEFRKIHVTVRFWAYRNLYRLILLHFTFKVLTIRLFFSLFLYLFMLKYIIYSPSRLLFVCRECSVLSLSFSICIIQHHLPSFLYSESLMKCRETQPWGGEHTDTSVVYCDFLQSL